jgi:hypothetical protein
MRFEIVERDFVKRTLEILEQYDKCVVPHVGDGQQLEVTLLLNCLLGLIILPVEHCQRTQKKDLPQLFNQDDRRIGELGPEWGLSNLNIVKYRSQGQEVDPDAITLRALIVMFRHCMAHGRFADGSLSSPDGMSVVSNEDQRNGSVILDVKLVNKHKETTEFVASIPAKDLRLFGEQIARSFVRDFRLDPASSQPPAGGG